MAFSTKYKLEFDEQIGYPVGKPHYVQKHWEVRILEDGFAGAVTEMEGTANPLTVQWDGSGGDAFGIEDDTSVIKPSRAVINVYSTQDQYKSLWNVTDSFTHKVEVYEDGNLYWTGFVNPDKWTEAYSETVFPIQILATDGLEKLGDIDYPVGTTRIDGFEVLRNCLDTLNLGIGYWTATHLYDFDAGGAAGFMLDDFSYDQTSFTDIIDGSFTRLSYRIPQRNKNQRPDILINGGGNKREKDSFIFWTDKTPRETIQKSCYEVVMMLMNDYGFRLYQRKGLWNVREVVEISGVEEQFNSSGGGSTYPGTPPTVTLQGASLANPVIFNGQIQVIRPLKQLTINYNGFPAINYFAGGEFDSHVWNFAATDFNTSAWNKFGSATISRVSSTLIDDSSHTNYGCKITSTATNTSTYDYIYNCGQKVTKDDVFWFSFRYRADISSGSGTAPQIGYTLHIDMPNGEYREGGGTSWFYASTPVWFSSVPDAHNVWQTVTGGFTVPEDGVLVLRLHEIVPNGYTASGVSFDRCICENTTTTGIAFKQYDTDGRDNESYKYEIVNSLDYVDKAEMTLARGDRSTYGRAIYQNSEVSYIRLTLTATPVDPGTKITLDIAGTTQTYTYVSSGYSFMSDDFTTVDDLIAEIEYDDGSSEYTVWKEASGSNWRIHIEAKDWDSNLDFGTVTPGDSELTDAGSTKTDAVLPTTITSWQTQYDTEADANNKNGGNWILSDGEVYPLAEAIGRQIMISRSKPITKLKGKIIDYTKELDVGSLIYDPHGNKYYYINQFLVSCKKGEINIEAIEENNTLSGTLTTTKTVI